MDDAQLSQVAASLADDRTRTDWAIRHVAVDMLVAGRSYREVAEATGLHRNTLRRLWNNHTNEASS